MEVLFLFIMFPLAVVFDINFAHAKQAWAVPS
jgi:hypothetical protein